MQSRCPDGAELPEQTPGSTLPRSHGPQTLTSGSKPKSLQQRRGIAGEKSLELWDFPLYP